VQRLKFRELVKEQKYIRVLSKEILKRMELEKKLTEMAHIDSLTGACNRRYFMDIAEHEKRKSHRVGSPLSIILIDIDDFKVINDTYGHAVGDMALKKFMKICKSTLRESDVIGRMGGEEFAILCIDSDKMQTLEIANRLCKNIEVQTINLKYHFTVSIGVSEIKPEYKSIDKALHLADLVLYEAKREGKNQVKVA
jgi:diguanylate cyclase (GGDEF)-like protein